MIFSRTVVTAAEIMATLPPNEDDMYTIWGALKRDVPEEERCQARKGLEDHCPRRADAGYYCEGHYRRRLDPPAYCEWDAPIKATRGRVKGVSPGVRRDKQAAQQAG